MTMQTGSELKKQITRSLDELPEEVLVEIAAFMEYLQYKRTHTLSSQSPYKPVALGGLWKGVMLTDEDIADVRHEMWQNFGSEPQ